MKEELTRERALELHRKMWESMQRDLGNCPVVWNRVEYKSEWCRLHGYNICNDCFLCEYDVQHNDGARCQCLIEWKYGRCTDNSYYYTAPISEILALPERSFEDEGK